MRLPKVVGVILALCLSFGALSSVLGQEREWHERGWHGDIRVFHERDVHVWRAGRWYHGWYGGRFGWFWIAGGAYYLYSAPIYPYPDPYTPPVVVQQAPVVVQQQPAYVERPQQSAAPSQPANTWYYCDAAKGYYPYVNECPGGWRAVPATPATSAAR